MKKKEVYSKIFEIFQRENPKPETELIFQDPYTLLIAVMLSAQTTDAQVNKATPRLFSMASNPRDMSLLSEEEIAQAISSLNLYKSKARYVLHTSKILVEKHDSRVPNSLKELTQLPGVGKKTANVVLNVVFGEATLPIDTHVARVANRLAMTNSKNTDVIEQDLLKKIPEKFLNHAHHWLVLHGRYVCKAKKPLCGSCKIAELCDFALSTQQ